MFIDNLSYTSLVKFYGHMSKHCGHMSVPNLTKLVALLWLLWFLPKTLDIITQIVHKHDADCR